jgi:PAS domain S-box-containing protein
MPCGIFAVDGAGIVTWADAILLRMFGYAEHELVGRHIGVLMSDTDRDEVAGHVARHRDGARTGLLRLGREIGVRRRDGSTVAVEMAQLALAPDGACAFVCVALSGVGDPCGSGPESRHVPRMRYSDADEAERCLARDVMERLMQRDGLADRRLRHALLPAQRPGGDALAAARSPRGRLYAMLADAAGHGLAAAVNLLPAIAVFYGMAARDLPLGMIAGEMNARLRRAMPVGRLVAAALVCLDERRRSGEVWVGGTPDLLWLDPDSHVIARFASNRLPLGASDTTPAYVRAGFFEWTQPGQLFACSDGLCEARSPAGDRFCADRLMAALAGSGPQQRLAAVESQLRSHLGGLANEDDVSLLGIDLI